ncbi:beta-lactamase family protein [Planctomycetota bacterium]|nr:beta-lactamase family protein [Planctomycetota bacterium]
MVLAKLTTLLAAFILVLPIHADLNDTSLPNGTGISAAIITEQGIEYLQFGNPEFNEHSLFEIGSITKTFTSLAAALHDNQTPGFLDSKLSQLIPETADSKTAGITPLQLATHTAGLTRISLSIQLNAIVYQSDPYKTHTRKILINDLTFVNSLPQYPTYAYSNFGYAVLGLALEKSTKKQYANFIHDEILKPLKMFHTFVHYTPDNEKTAVKAHDAQGNATSKWHFIASAPAGSIKSSAHDLALYIQAYLKPKETSLSQAMQKTLKKQHEIKENRSIGLGWHISNKNSQTIYWHTGGTGGFRTFIGFNPATKKGCVLLCNYAGVKKLDQEGFEILMK